jgi:aspartate aminotransferase
MNKIQSQSTSNASSIAQKAALAAVAGPQDFPAVMKEAFAPRLDYIMNALAEIEGVTCVKPSGAFYVFPNISAYYGRSFNGKKIEGSLDMADYLLDEYKIAAVPGIAFGADRFIRFSFATSMEVIKDGMNRFKEALKRLE